MAVRHAVITLDFAAVDAGVSQQAIKQRTTAGTRFTIDHTHALARDVFNLSEAFGIAWRNHQSFFPVREGDHTEVLIRKLLSDVRKVEFAGPGIFEVRAGDVNLPFLQ